MMMMTCIGAHIIVMPLSNQRQICEKKGSSGSNKQYKKRDGYEQENEEVSVKIKMLHT